MLIRSILVVATLHGCKKIGDRRFTAEVASKNFKPILKPNCMGEPRDCDLKSLLITSAIKSQ